MTDTWNMPKKHLGLKKKKTIKNNLKIWIESFPKKAHRWHNCISAYKNISLENCRLKQYNTTIYLLELTKFKTLRTSNDKEDM